ncbi:hypothetical protein EJ02DRAFT_422122 [Clathrospora elynae]|uniref:Uncharacterized protein n=1 Tax=Clathrospora elynae TaxID=706981 RepID=A0A6A5SRW4_9PLEO|nr:hypothetical protein EJ02DRAFT_422122 [Clathrospora elynae]
MEQGLEPGADFFDDGSSDSGWEDSEGDVTAHAKYGSVSRGTSRQKSLVTALPSFHGQDSGLGIEYGDALVSSAAGTSRYSLRSKDSDAASSIGERVKPFPSIRHGYTTTTTALPQNPRF